jgi:HSP20 family protein
MSQELIRSSDDEPAPAAGAAGPAEKRLIFTPPIDIFETDAGLMLLADLPGVSAESLQLQVQDNRLTLYGKVQTSLPPDAQLIHQEYRLGDYLRSFILSDDVNHQEITARLSNGVLEVFLPKAKKPEPRRIQISTE